MNKSEINIDEPVEQEVVSYTLRGIPKWAHEEVAAYARELGYKREKKFNLEETYTEAVIEWAKSRKELQKAV